MKNISSSLRPLLSFLDLFSYISSKKGINAATYQFFSLKQRKSYLKLSHGSSPVTTMALIRTVYSQKRHLSCYLFFPPFSVCKDNIFFKKNSYFRELSNLLQEYLNLLNICIKRRRLLNEVMAKTDFYLKQWLIVKNDKNISKSVLLVFVGPLLFVVLLF